MNQSLSKSAQSVQDALATHGLECQVVVLSESTRTASEAAASIGCLEAQIVKSLIFRTKISQQPVLILASGPNRVSEKIIEGHLSEKIEKADAAFTRDVTGFAIGGIPPVGHRQKIENVFIDEDLLTHESVWAAAGTPNAVFKLTSQDLVVLTAGKIISIKEGK